MQINRRKYNRARLGTVRLQSQYRGNAVRKVNAATKIQSVERMHVQNSAYRKLKSATIALQCCARRGKAKKIFDQVKKDQKDMGKMKQQNVKLKEQMASLKAMLQAQAASKADKAENEQAIAEKQKEIDHLEARIEDLEAALAQEKENVKRLEDDLNVQRNNNEQLTQDLQYQKELVSRGGSGLEERKHSRGSSMNAIGESSPMTDQRKHSRAQSAGTGASSINFQKAEKLVDAVVVGQTISPEALAEHRGEVARLEEQLEEERRMSRAARIEVKNLRAAMVDKGVVDVTTSTEISDNISEFSGSEMDRSDIPIPSEVEPQMRYVNLLHTMRVKPNRVCSIIPLLPTRVARWSHFRLCYPSNSN